LERRLFDLLERFTELKSTFAEHLLALTLLPVGLAVAIALPLAVAVRHVPWLRSAAIGASSVVQTIPSLAMLAFLLPIFGIGKVPAVIALTLYAILPILQSACVALRDLPADVLEAADGMGFSAWQRLTLVEFPLILPFVFSGIRTATVICVGVATLSTFIGAGGLGDFINRGLALDRTSLLLIGAGSAAALALILDFLIDTVGAALRPGRKSRSVPLRLAASGVLAVMLAAFILIPPPGGAATGSRTIDGQAAVSVGAKNFTEQLILGELLAQWIEGRTGRPVERRFPLGGTVICHEALVNGGIDLYVEYTGTALLNLLDRGYDSAASPADVLEEMRRAYRERFDVEVLQPLGFENTYAIAMPRSRAEALGWEQVSQLAADAGDLHAGFTAEFMEREDGLPGLRRAYGLRFGRVSDLAPELMYSALAQGGVDVIGAFSTDARILMFDLVALEDDRAYFPPYEAVPVVRRSTLARFPELEPVLAELAGRIGNDVMTRLNHAVDVEKRSPRDVVAEFLKPFFQDKRTQETPDSSTQEP